jgi:hypothetical protein
MAFAALAFSVALASIDAPVLNGEALAAAAREQNRTGAPAALEHHRFRVELPVLWAKARKVPNFKSPAVWRYDARSSTLEVAIGFGQISPQNYDKFDAQGLAALPPLQTAFFAVNESKNNLHVAAVNSGGSNNDEIQSYTQGVRSQTSSYGLATPLGAGGEIAGMPKDFKPLMVYRAKIDGRKVREVVDNLKLVIEGEVTSFGPAGSVVCGQYDGGVEAHEITGSTAILMRDRQCFVAATIHGVAVAGKGGYYLRWGETAVGGSAP